MFSISHAQFPEDLDEVTSIFREYVASPSVSLDFQGYEREFAALPGQYAAPDGRILLARQGSRVVGCAALRRASPGRRASVRVEAGVRAPFGKRHGGGARFGRVHDRRGARRRLRNHVSGRLAGVSCGSAAIPVPGVCIVRSGELQPGSRHAVPGPGPTVGARDMRRDWRVAIRCLRHPPGANDLPVTVGREGLGFHHWRVSAETPLFWQNGVHTKRGCCGY